MQANSLAFVRGWPADQFVWLHVIEYYSSMVKLFKVFFIHYVTIKDASNIAPICLCIYDLYPCV